MIEFLLLIAILATLALAAFCAGVETGFLSVSRERILHLSREGGKKARLVERALTDMGRTTTTLLIGNNLASVAYSTASAALILRVFPSSTAQSLASFLAACTVLYVSEFLPKLLMAARPLRRTLALAPYYALLETALRPLTVCALLFTGLFLRRSKPRAYKPTSKDLLRILQDRKDGVRLSDFESALISRLVVLRIKNRPVTSDEILAALRDKLVAGVAAGIVSVVVLL